MKRLTLIAVWIILSTNILVQAQSSSLDTTFKCLYNQLHFAEPIYLFDNNPSIDSIIDEICEKANVEKNFMVLGAAIPGIAALKDSTGRYLLYSPSFARRLMNSNRSLLYAILAHEIGHLLRDHSLSDQFRISQESAADEFMGRVLFQIGDFTDLGQIINAINAAPFAYDYLYDNTPGLRNKVISNGWQSSEDYIISRGSLGYFENKSPESDLSLPVFIRRGCPRNFEFPKEIFDTCTNLGEVDHLFTRALINLGYEQKRYYYLHNGFALLTPVEQIHKNGKALSGQERWQDYPAGGGFDGILDYLSSIIFPRPGYFRLFVFYVTDRNMEQEKGELKHDEARAWLRDGEFWLPPILKNKALTEAHQISVMLYEFKVLETKKQMKEICTNNLLSLNDHLNQSGILRALTQN